MSPFQGSFFYSHGFTQAYSLGFDVSAPLGLIRDE
jgi:hypothetical protein